MRLSLGNDHAGFPLKSCITDFLKSESINVIDFGTHSTDPVDFPDITRLVCGAVTKGEVDRGIMICGTGVGASIAANKIPGIRAAVCHDGYSAHQCVEHDDVNVLCIGAQIVGTELAKEIVATFVKAQFSTEEQFRRRVQKLAELEKVAALELADGNT